MCKRDIQQIYENIFFPTASLPFLHWKIDFSVYFLYWNIKYNFWPSNTKEKKILLTEVQCCKNLKASPQHEKRAHDSPNSNIFHFGYRKFKAELNVCRHLWEVRDLPEMRDKFDLKISKATISCDFQPYIYGWLFLEVCSFIYEFSHSWHWTITSWVGFSPTSVSHIQKATVLILSTLQRLQMTERHLQIIS